MFTPPISTNSAPIRLAIISTPRSGNTWLRHLLGRIWSLQQVAVHELPDAAWATLPTECVLQLHWHREPAFVQRLEAEGFRVITLARHPFDVLISVLHVAVYGVASEYWLGGLHGDETSLWAAMPCSRAFLEYAAGPRAAALFQITNDWWQVPGITSMRYEDLVHDPAATLHGLEELLGPPRGESIESAVQQTSIRKLRVETGHTAHFWLGRAGLWRELIPTEQAREMEQALLPTFQKLGYACDPAPELTASQADRNWVQHFGHELRLTLNRYNGILRSPVGQMQLFLEESNLAMKDWEARWVAMDLARQRAETDRDNVYREMDRLRLEVGAARHRLSLIEGCGRFSLKVARLVQACVNCLGRLRRKKLVHPARGKFDTGENPV